MSREIVLKTVDYIEYFEEDLRDRLDTCVLLEGIDLVEVLKKYDRDTYDRELKVYLEESAFEIECNHDFNIKVIFD